MLYDANSKPIESTVESKSEDDGYNTIPSRNFDPPTPKPEWFDAELLKIGGYVPSTEIPKYRVVWGMTEKCFAMGEMHMKYIAIIDTIKTTTGYNVYNSRTDKRAFMSVEKAHARYMDPVTQTLSLNIKPGEIISPVVREETREIGMPVWVAEYYMEPEGFGTEEQWERERYLINPEKPTQYFDVLGPYPKQGRYIEWFMLFDVDEDGKQIYRSLDDGAIELIRANHVLNVVRRKNMPYDTLEARRAHKEAKFDEDWDKFDKELTHDILDVKANRKFNITPKG